MVNDVALKKLYSKALLAVRNYSAAEDEVIECYRLLSDAFDEAKTLRAERDQLRRLLSDWREQYSDGYGPDGDLIDGTDALLAQEDKRECGFIYIKRERDQLWEALKDTQRLLGRYLYLAGDIATNSASYRYEANSILLAQEDEDDE